MSFYNNLKLFKNNVALMSENQEFTYSELLQKGHLLSSKLKSNSLIFLLIDIAKKNFPYLRWRIIKLSLVSLVKIKSPKV